MAGDTVRIPPVPIAELSAEQSRLIGDWTHLTFSRVLVNNPRMYQTFVTHLAEVVARTNLPSRDRQIVCLRMLELCGDVYEKTHHIVISRKSGLTDEEISAFVAGSGSCLNAFDHTVLNATRELYSAQCIEDATWQQLAQRYNQQQLMEIVFLAGCYQTMAMLTKSFGIQLEPDLESFNALRKYV
jgi:4-carboxymuconolactone decarboxylase